MFVPIAGPEGIEWVSKDALRPEDLSTVGSHWNAIQTWQNSGNDAPLLSFEGQVKGGVPLITDPDLIAELTQAGELDFDSFYLEAPPS